MVLATSANPRQASNDANSKLIELFVVFDLFRSVGMDASDRFTALMTSEFNQGENGIQVRWKRLKGLSLWGLFGLMLLFGTRNQLYFFPAMLTDAPVR
jgi:hypothetical protein